MDTSNKTAAKAVSPAAVSPTDSIDTTPRGQKALLLVAVGVFPFFLHNNIVFWIFSIDWLYIYLFPFVFLQASAPKNGIVLDEDQQNTVLEKKQKSEADALAERQRIEREKQAEAEAK